jgi:hypothetical protein
MFLEHLDDCGNKGLNLAEAIEEVFESAKHRGWLSGRLLVRKKGLRV